MFDKVMFWMYEFVVTYHTMRGSGATKLKSLQDAYKIASENNRTKPISDFQKNMYQVMQEIAKDRKL